MLSNRTLTFDHLSVGSTAPPGDASSSGNWQKASPDSTAVVNSRSRPGRKAALLIHNAGVDPINSSGERLEAADFRDSATRERYGTEGWYGTAFVLDELTPPTSWGIVAQLHHAGVTGSPPFALRVDKWGGDPDTTTPGHMYIAYRDTPTGQEKYLHVEPYVPLGVTVRVKFHIKWGGTATSSYPGLIEMWTSIGGGPWTQQHPEGGWKVTTCYQESSASYWKFGWYSGASISTKLEHDGIYRAQTAADIDAWFGSVAPPPPPPPPPDDEAVLLARIAELEAEVADLDDENAALSNALTGALGRINAAKAALA